MTKQQKLMRKLLKEFRKNGLKCQLVSGGKVIL